MTNKIQNQKLIKVLKSGGVAVIPTDTIYGLVGQALNNDTVDQIYQIKGRTPTKPLIILISALEHLSLFDVKLSEVQKKALKNYWPGPVSIILKCHNSKFEYLTRGTKTLAFRMPKDDFLINLISKTGPLVAPSANPEGLEPVKNINSAKNYFGNKIDYYYDGGDILGKPSKIIDLTNGLKIIRQ